MLRFIFLLYFSIVVEIEICQAVVTHCIQCTNCNNSALPSSYRCSDVGSAFFYCYKSIIKNVKKLSFFSSTIFVCLFVLKAAHGSNQQVVIRGCGVGCREYYGVIAETYCCREDGCNKSVPQMATGNIILLLSIFAAIFHRSRIGCSWLVVNNF